jgi:lysophospholipase L1-like esterase
MTRKTFRKLLAAASVLLIPLIALEVAVRMWGYSERHIYDPIYTSFDRTIDIPYIHKPNLTEARARGLAVINTDSLGLRTKRVGASYGFKRPNEYRIAIVGDSVTFGEGVPKTDDTFAQVLEDTLNQDTGRIVRVLNYGASAYSVKQMAASLEYRMADAQPDLVMLAIIPEDLNVSRTPGIDAVGYLVDRRVSFLRNSIAREVLRPIRLTYVLREVTLNWMSPSQDYESSRSLELGEIPESYRYVKNFKAIAEKYRIPYVVVLLPRTKENVWGPFPSRLTQDGVTYLDLSPLGREFTTQEFVASQFDRHPSAAVHHRIGKALADWVQRELRTFR